jgi:hypothetical protein
MQSTTTTTTSSAAPQKNYAAAFGDLQSSYGFVGAPIVSNTLITPMPTPKSKDTNSSSSSIKSTASSAFTRVFKSMKLSKSSRSLRSNASTYCASSDDLVHTKTTNAGKKDYEAAFGKMQAVQGFVGAPIIIH